MLVVVCGVPGVGKTSIAEYVAERLDADLQRTDVVRKEILEDPEYTDEEAWMVYDELVDRGERAVERGEDVVLDGTFHDRRFRERAREVTERAGEECQFVKVECDPDTARERIRAREDDESDADVAVHDMFRDVFESLSVEHVTVDNSGSLPAAREQVDEAFAAAAAGVGDRF